LGKTDSSATVEIDSSLFKNNQMGALLLRHVRTVVKNCSLTRDISPVPYYGLLCDSLAGAESIRVQNVKVCGAVQLYGIACTHCRGTGSSTLDHVSVTGETLATANAGIYLDDANESLSVVTCEVLNYRGQAGLRAESSQSPISSTTVWADTSVPNSGVVGMDFVGSTCKVRACTIRSWRIAVRSNGDNGTRDVPDMGTESDPGNCSVVLTESLCVANLSADTLDTLYAQVNCWYGDTSSSWFLGNVVWIPDLPAEPGRGDGGQGAAVLDPLLVTELYAAAPNPVTRQTRICYQVGTSGRVALQVHDLSGRVVRTLVSAFQESGRYALTWDRRDDKGQPAAEGVYFMRLESPGVLRIRKIVLAQ
jgi:hypothetical protein